MGMTVVGDEVQLAEAIDSFDESYHADYFSVRGLAKEYLSLEEPSRQAVNSLATVLHTVLKRYGAERQKAPTRRSLAEFESALADDKLHKLLQFFAAHPLTGLGVVNRMRTSDASVAEMDGNLVKVLRLLGEKLFRDNTNVTYPMKALMLISGYMPALDSQVRCGLAKANISGVGATRFLLPKATDDLEGKKITRLPFILAQCYSQINCKTLIDKAIQRSKYCALSGEIGRVFDVLLFMQAKSTPPLG